MANIGQQARGRDRQRKLVDAAMELFAATGYRGTGIAAIANAAGVTGATLLHHFGSKEGLLQAILEERDEQTSESWQAIVEPGGVQAIRNIVEVARSWRDAPGIPRLHAVLLAENLDADAPMRRYFVARQRWLRRSLREAIETGQARGEIRADIDAELTAAEITVFLDGAILQWALDPRQTPLEDLFEHYADRLVEALRSPA